MDVLVVMIREPEVEGASVWVWFKAIARINGSRVLQVYFRVAYQFGTTLVQKRTAITNAARTAGDEYAAAHGIALPAVNQIEILGI